MEALHENVEWTEVIEVLKPFLLGIFRERERSTLGFCAQQIM
jgi:hypothetical protein